MFEKITLEPLERIRPLPVDAPWKISIEDVFNHSWMLDEWPCHWEIFMFQWVFRFSRVRMFRIFENLKFWRFEPIILRSFSWGFRWKSLETHRTKQMTVYEQIPFFYKTSKFLSFFLTFTGAAERYFNECCSPDPASEPQTPFKSD